MSHNAKGWYWAHFFSDGTLFQGNHFNKTAWCIRCLDHTRNVLRESDVASASLTGIPALRTDIEREAQGNYSLIISKPPILSR